VQRSSVAGSQFGIGVHPRLSAVSLHCKAAISCFLDKKDRKKERGIKPQQTQEDAKKDEEPGGPSSFLFALFAFFSAKVILVAAGGRAGASASSAVRYRLAAVSRR
jgi:hypothetical protein